MFLGRRLRCIACDHVFTAATNLAPPPPAGYRVLPEPTTPLPSPAPSETVGRARYHLPLCPGCRRPVGWDAAACPNCKLLLDPLDADDRGQWSRRRDAQPHRGQLIDSLGSVSLFAGALSLCTGPLGFFVALLAGVPALVMARNDLEQMQAGVIDPAGQSVTEFGRNKATFGMVLAMLFVLFFFLALGQLQNF
jgi:hypothetical protein